MRNQQQAEDAQDLQVIKDGISMGTGGLMGLLSDSRAKKVVPYGSLGPLMVK